MLVEVCTLQIIGICANVVIIIASVYETTVSARSAELSDEVLRESERVSRDILLSSVE